MIQYDIDNPWLQGGKDCLIESGYVRRPHKLVVEIVIILPNEYCIEASWQWRGDRVITDNDIRRLTRQCFHVHQCIRVDLNDFAVINPIPFAERADSRPKRCGKTTRHDFSDFVTLFESDECDNFR